MKSRSKRQRISVAGRASPATETARPPTPTVTVEDSGKVAGLLGDIETGLKRLEESLGTQVQVMETQRSVVQDLRSQSGVTRQFFDRAAGAEAYAARFGRMWT
jgi:hypothetical protein